MTTAQGNAVQRVTFLRWWRSGWGAPGPNTYNDGHLQVNFTDDASGVTIKTDINVPDGPEGAALVLSLAALNGLALVEDHTFPSSAHPEGRCMEWHVGNETPRLHGWHGHEVPQ